MYTKHARELNNDRLGSESPPTPIMLPRDTSNCIDTKHQCVHIHTGERNALATETGYKSCYATVKQWISQHQTLTGLFLSIILMIFLWFTFSECMLCVLVIFIISALLCMRLPYLSFVFWPSLIVLFMNTHALREVKLKVDVPVGSLVDNLWPSATTAVDNPSTQYGNTDPTGMVQSDEALAADYDIPFQR